MMSWQRQRGAAAVFAALAIVAAVSAFSLVFHAAQLYLAKRDLQRITNMAAMDAAMVIGGCVDGRLEDMSALARDQARLSVLRNGDAGAVNWLDDGEVVIGELTRAGGLRSVTTPRGSDRTPAVRVTMSRPQPSFLTGAFGGASGARVVASASAIAGPAVTPRVGSYVFQADSGQESTVGRLLYSNFLGGGTRAELSVAGYQGLFDTQVQLGQLVRSGATVLDGEDILTSNVEFLLGDFINAVYQSVAGNLSASVDRVLGDIVTGLDPALTVVPAEVFDIVGDPDAVDDALFVNLGEIVETAVLVANSTVPIDLAPILGLPGVATIVPRIRVIDPGAVTIGGDLFSEEGEPLTRASTAQITLDADISLLGTTPGTSLLDLNLHAALARASAAVTDIRCATTARPYHEVDVETVSTLAAVEIRDARLNLPALLGGVQSLGGTVISVDSTHTAPLTFGGPGVTYPQTLSAPAVSDDLVPAIGAALGDLVRRAELPLLPAPLQAQLEVLLRDVLLQIADDALEGSLARAFEELGLRIAGADVTIESVSVQRPTLLTHQQSR